MKFEVGDIVKIVRAKADWSQCWRDIVGKPIKIVGYVNCYYECNTNLLIPYKSNGSFVETELEKYHYQLQFDFMSDEV